MHVFFSPFFFLFNKLVATERDSSNQPRLLTRTHIRRRLGSRRRASTPIHAALAHTRGLSKATNNSNSFWLLAAGCCCQLRSSNETATRAPWSRTILQIHVIRNFGGGGWHARVQNGSNEKNITTDKSRVYLSESEQKMKENRVKGWGLYI